MYTHLCQFFETFTEGTSSEVTQVVPGNQFSIRVSIPKRLLWGTGDIACSCMSNSHQFSPIC